MGHKFEIARKDGHILIWSVRCFALGVLFFAGMQGKCTILLSNWLFFLPIKAQTAKPLGCKARECHKI
jgi:hypothetical protein